jgi:hypothetical protein
MKRYEKFKSVRFVETRTKAVAVWFALSIVLKPAKKEGRALRVGSCGFVFNGLVLRPCCVYAQQGI